MSRCVVYIENCTVRSSVFTDASSVSSLTGAGGGWLSRRQHAGRDDVIDGQHVTDGRAVLGELTDASVGGRPCQQSTSDGWHTDGGFGGGAGGCLGGGAGGGYTGLYFVQTLFEPHSTADVISSSL